ncbi:F-box only protein 36-like [Gigantopelta aegis]|uniref:F-box only protein 36-like n=1 Tax=Gigantopelta aegis TaxID=1735272 RepID=UPI001B888F76|nr:F-box only protein 36-like [Gigantopelta aegis]
MNMHSSIGRTVHTMWHVATSIDPPNATENDGNIRSLTNICIGWQRQGRWDGDCIKMASIKHWLNSEGALVDIAEVAPSPSKDFFHIFVTPNLFVYRLWKIIPPTRSDSNVAPTEIRDTWEDFKHDETLHSEITRTGGSSMLDYLINLSDGHIDYLPRLPKNVLLRIILMLDLEDIQRLRRVSKFFKKLCDGDELWEKIYRMNCETPITSDLKDLAEQHTWKRLFFTNKLQLQMHLRRQSEKQTAKATTKQATKADKKK